DAGVRTYAARSEHNRGGGARRGAIRFAREVSGAGGALAGWRENAGNAQSQRSRVRQRALSSIAGHGRFVSRGAPRGGSLRLCDTLRQFHGRLAGGKGGG